jgi:hypothetical protein
MVPDMEAYKIRAAVLRRRGGPLEIEIIEMEVPEGTKPWYVWWPRVSAIPILTSATSTEPFADAKAGGTIKPVLRISKVQPSCSF